MQIALSATPPARPGPLAAVPAPPVASATGVSGTASATRVLNPDLHLDPSLGIVVTEYFNAHGDETQQFPTEKAIQRYQLFGLDAAGSTS